MRADPVPPSLTSEPDRFSDEAWDLLLATQETARRWRHGAMDVEHLLQTLLLERRFAPWLDPLPLDPDRLLDRVESFCVDQPGSTGDALYIGDALEDLLEDAERCRAAWGSPLLDGPHLLMALVRDPRIGASLLGGEGLSEDLLLRQFRPGAAAVPATSTLPLQPPVVPAAAPASPPAVPASAGLLDAWIDTARPAASLPSPSVPSPPPEPSSELRLEQEPPEASALER